MVLIENEPGLTSSEGSSELITLLGCSCLNRTRSAQEWRLLRIQGRTFPKSCSGYLLWARWLDIVAPTNGSEGARLIPSGAF